MSPRKNKKYLILSVVCIAALGLLFAETNPRDVSLSFLLLPIALIFVLIFSIFNLILGYISRIDGQKKFFGSFIAAASISLIIILSSVGSMSWSDLIVIAIIMAIAAIYLTKAILPN